MTAFLTANTATFAVRLVGWDAAASNQPDYTFETLQEVLSHRLAALTTFGSKARKTIASSGSASLLGLTAVSAGALFGAIALPAAAVLGSLAALTYSGYIAEDSDRTKQVRLLPGSDATLSDVGDQIRNGAHCTTGINDTSYLSIEHQAEFVMLSVCRDLLVDVLLPMIPLDRARFYDRFVREIVIGWSMTPESRKHPLANASMNDQRLVLHSVAPSITSTLKGFSVNQPATSAPELPARPAQPVRDAAPRLAMPSAVQPGPQALSENEIVTATPVQVAGQTDLGDMYAPPAAVPAPAAAHPVYSLPSDLTGLMVADPYSTIIVAKSNSGKDVLLSNIISDLRDANPGIHFVGIDGKNLAHEDGMWSKYDEVLRFSMLDPIASYHPKLVRLLESAVKRPGKVVIVFSEINAIAGTYTTCGMDKEWGQIRHYLRFLAVQGNGHFKYLYGTAQALSLKELGIDNGDRSNVNFLALANMTTFDAIRSLNKNVQVFDSAISNRLQFEDAVCQSSALGHHPNVANLVGVAYFHVATKEWRPMPALRNFGVERFVASQALDGGAPAAHAPASPAAHAPASPASPAAHAPASPAAPAPAVSDEVIARQIEAMVAAQVAKALASMPATAVVEDDEWEMDDSVSSPSMDVVHQRYDQAVLDGLRGRQSGGQISSQTVVGLGPVIRLRQEDGFPQDFPVRSRGVAEHSLARLTLAGYLRAIPGQPGSYLLLAD